MNSISTTPRKRLPRMVLPLIGLAAIVGIAIWNREAIKRIWADHIQAGREDAVSTASSPIRKVKRPLFELVPDKPDTMRLVDRDPASLGISVYTIGSDPPPNKLRLPGVLSLDPNRFVRVHSRFPGEVRRVGTATGTNRPLQYGDKVGVGQLLATIWSKDVGEKKSELVDALSKVHFDKIVLDRLIKSGVVPERTITDAERNYQGDMVAVAKAERTLRSWNFSETEIEAVRQETRDIIELVEKLRHPGQISDKNHSLVHAVVADDGHWAELDVVAPQEGMIAEKNFNVGDIVDTSLDLLKIADIDRLQVLANVFEEDLPLLRRLAPEEKKWSLQLKSEAVDTAILGHFDQIGMIVDPKMHTSVVMGYTDNTKRNLAIGQFITATIEVPGDPTQVVIPVSAVIEQGSTTAVFVESNAERHEFTRRLIAVTRRGRTIVHVRSEPDKIQTEQGARSLRAGERVLVNAVVELDAELNDLTSSAPKK